MKIKLRKLQKRLTLNILRKKIGRNEKCYCGSGKKNSNIVVERYKKAIDIKIIAIMVPTE